MQRGRLERGTGYRLEVVLRSDGSDGNSGQTSATDVRLAVGKVHDSGHCFDEGRFDGRARNTIDKIKIITIAPERQRW